MARAKKPARLGAYEPIERIGEGSMGEIWLCHDNSLDRPVVVKRMQIELRSTHDLLERFQREVQVLASLSHPNIVGVYGYWTEEGMLHLSMEFINGWTLRQILEKKPLIPLWAALAILRDSLSALAHAHRKRVVHRDLKPSNLMIGFHGRTKLLDFGVARHQSFQFDQNLTMPGTLIGTTAYMSPEQSRGFGANESSDLFSLGIIAWEMLTGKHPFRADSPTETLQRIQHLDLHPRDLPPETPRLLRDFLLSLLAKDPRERPLTAEEALNWLDQIMDGLPRDLTPYLKNFVLAARKGDDLLPQELPPWTHNRPMWQVAMASGLGGLTLGFLLSLLR